MSGRLSAYLDVMGIETWVLRDTQETAPPVPRLAGEAQAVVSAEPGSEPASAATPAPTPALEAEPGPAAQQPAPKLEPQPKPEPEPEPEPAPVYQSLADFPASDSGRILIACGYADSEEGASEQSGSAFVGEAAALLNAMLTATRWPAQQCVLLEQLEQLPQAIAQLQPELIVALGTQAAKAVQQPSVAAARGQRLQHGAAKLVVSYHPVQVLQNPKVLKRQVWADLQLAMAELSGT